MKLKLWRIGMNQLSLFSCCGQAREAELEQTIQELNAALVSSRNSGLVVGMVSNGTRMNENVSSDARIRGLQMELETANSHLASERERVRRHQDIIDPKHLL